jgi:hypothetical protein
VKNIASFVCPLNSQVWNHFAVHLPRWVDLRTIDERAWVSEMKLRIRIDRATFGAVGEYLFSKTNEDTEFFIDITGVNRDSMLELLTSSEIVVEFGPEQERIEIRQMSRTPNGGDVEGFIDAVVPKVSKAIGGGEVRNFSADSMLRTCAGFNKTGRWSERR